MSSKMEECQAYVPWIMTLLEKAKLGADPVEFVGKALTEKLADKHDGGGLIFLG